LQGYRSQNDYLLCVCMRRTYGPVCPPLPARSLAQRESTASIYTILVVQTRRATASIYTILVVQTRRARERESERAREQESERARERERVRERECVRESLSCSLSLVACTYLKPARAQRVLYMCQIRQYDMHVCIYMYVYIYTHTHKRIHARTHTLSLAEIATSFHTTTSHHPKKLYFSTANASSHNSNR